MNEAERDPELLDRVNNTYREAYNEALGGPTASLAGYKAAGVVLDMLAAEGRLCEPGGQS